MQSSAIEKKKPHPNKTNKKASKSTLSFQDQKLQEGEQLHQDFVCWALLRVFLPLLHAVQIQSP